MAEVKECKNCKKVKSISKFRSHYHECNKCIVLTQKFVTDLGWDREDARERASFGDSVEGKQKYWRMRYESEQNETK